MTTRLEGERGSAMLMALGALVVLAVLAGIIASIVLSEKWMAFNAYTHSRSFYSADAASEAAVNWLREQPSPPAIVGSGNRVFVPGSFTSLGPGDDYKYEVKFVRKRFRPGWSIEYGDYEYRIDADGTSARGSQSGIEVTAVRLFREGY